MLIYYSIIAAALICGTHTLRRLRNFVAKSSLHGICYF